MATNNQLPPSPVTTQSAGYTDKQKDEASVLIAQLEAQKANRDAVRRRLYDEARATGLSVSDADTASINSAEYKEAVAAVDLARNNYNGWVQTNEPQDPTYWDGTGNQITKEEYEQVRALEQGAGISIAGGSNITATESTGVVSDADPLAAQTEANADLAEGVAVDPVGGVIDETTADIAGVRERAENERQEPRFDPDDWRVRLHLAPNADYLYKAKPDPGILAPLAETDGIIFPYTPEIQVQYNANYENYDLTHSNYRGYFYTGSQVENIIVTATFTANDLKEANYMLASMHFLRSATKMFYGKDAQRGMPPPLVFLTGLGEYQFNNHPCAITMMNYNLPTDVDFIPCGIANGVNNGDPLPRPKINAAQSGLSDDRMNSAGLAYGGKPQKRTQTADGRSDSAGPDITYSRSTYVPTKIEINFTMIPIQTREQVSNEFSLKDYASGKLLRRGFW